MKILHLPYNTASQTSITVRALNDIGVEARGLVVDKQADRRILDDSALEIFVLAARRKHPVTGLIKTLAWWKAVLLRILWADVIHWHSDPALPYDLDLRWAKWLGKARLVEFSGTDIRDNTVASADNPYWARICQERPMLLSKSAAGRERIRKFARYRCASLVRAVEMTDYIPRGLFPQSYETRRRLVVSEFQPTYPDPTKQHPLVVHAPSHPEFKGTAVVLQAVGQLQKTHEFDFRLLHNMSHRQALAILSQADIMLDQFSVGDHGVAAMEAMALGKPAVCYIKSSLLPRFPSDLPIVNANQDNLVEVLQGLIEDGPRRYELGRQGRAYVEKYHDAHVIAYQLAEIYRELMASKK